MSDPIDLVRRLSQDLRDRRRDVDRLDAYYRGKQDLSFLHPELAAQLSDRIQSLRVNFTRKVVDSVSERLYPEGFRLGKNESADADLWDIWQANDMPAWSKLGITSSLVHGRSFVSVWSSGDFLPRLAVESARQMTVRYKPGTRTLEAALKTWGEDDRNVTVLYLPDRILTYYTDRRSTPFPITDENLPEWSWIDPAVHSPDVSIENPLGVVPIVPFVNRPTLLDLSGESEMADIIPINDALNKLATDMMVSSEFHAMPRRWVTGMEIPRDDSALKRLSEKVKEEWTKAFPGKPYMGGKDVNFGQFAEASLDNFIAAMKALTSQMAAIASLPPDYFGLPTDSEPSASAINARESSLGKKIEDKQAILSNGYEQVMRLAVHVRDGKPPTDMDKLETLWREWATPTPAEKADAAVKLTQGENPVITIRQGQEDLGYTPGQIERMAQERAEAQALAATSTVRAQLDLARQLQAEGMPQSAALAAVGLIVASQNLNTPPQTTPSGG